MIILASTIYCTSLRILQRVDIFTSQTCETERKVERAGLNQSRMLDANVTRKKMTNAAGETNGNTVHYGTILVRPWFQTPAFFPRLRFKHKLGFYTIQSQRFMGIWKSRQH